MAEKTKEAPISSQRIKELYDLWYNSQLMNPYYEDGFDINGTGTSIYGGVGDMNNIGYNQMFGVNQQVGPLSLGFNRTHVGNNFFNDWSNKYSVGANGKNWNIQYEQQRKDNGVAHTYSLGGRVGKANVNADYTKDGDYKEYNAGISGKIGKVDSSLNYHKDNQGGRKIYAMFGGRF